MVGLSHFGSGQAYYRTHDVSSGGGPLFSSRISRQVIGQEIFVVGGWF